MFMPFGPDIEIVGLISLLNWVFAFAFPLLPYELFAFMPWIFALLATRALEPPVAQSMIEYVHQQALLPRLRCPNT
jgi:hypothetical protein